MADILHNLIIHAPLQKVYQAIATEEGVRNWWTAQSNIDSKTGGFAEFRFGDQYYNKMEITELIPDKKISWICLIGDEQWVDTEFHFDLSDQNGGTLLRFGHINWDEQTEFFGHCNFNWGKYLISLKKYCETGKGEPFKP